jgi:hypothetical protein
MAGALDDIGGGAQFDNLPQVHDCDAIGDVLHHRQIVRDEDQRQVHLPHEL